METVWLTNFSEYLKPRPREWHKGDSGYVLIIGGDQGYSGAPRMAAEAALRVGAGLVVVATHPAHAVMLNASRPEIMSHAVKQSSDITKLVKKADVIVLGPGLGQSAWSKKMLRAALKSTLPLVVDADALNLLAKQPVKKSNSRKKRNWVLTPHPAEAGRLLETSTYDVQKDRSKSINLLQKKYGGVVVLKGAGTLICTGNNALSVCQAGNPGMATAGMGDVLSGVIGGLIAQGVPLDEAAKMGVLVHAMAGDLAAARDGERGMLASDLMPYIRQLMNPS